jgi:arginase
MTSRGLQVVGAPIDSEALAEGCNLSPGVLRDTGLIKALNATDLGDLETTISEPRRDTVTGIIGFDQLCAASSTLRQAMTTCLQQPSQTLVMGGCCAALIGIVGAMRERYGRVGLVRVDGHLDFYSGVKSPTGSGADINQWVLSGYGPPGIADLGGPPPMVEPRDIWLLGYRDHEEVLRMRSPDPLALIPEAHFIDAAEVVAKGMRAVGGQAARALAADPGNFWVHLDLDVLSSRAMPAVDYWEEGGLDWNELRELLTPLVASPACAGLNVANYNPSLDPRRKHAPKIIALLEQVFAA